VSSFSTRRSEWRNSQVIFSSTSAAIKAMEGLDKNEAQRHDTQHSLYKANSSRADSWLAK
jgi:hypothetical protein